MKVTWLAAQGAAEDAVLEALGLEPAPEAAPGRWFEAPFVMRTFRDGWVVVAAMKGLDLDEDVRRLAAAHPGQTVGCYGSETVMVSEILAFEAGTLTWSALHDPDAAEDLQVEGPALALVGERLAKARRDQATDDEVDFVFDVPIDVAAGLTGFHPNEDENADWTALRPREGSGRAGLGGSKGRAGGGLLGGLLRALGLKS